MWTRVASCPASVAGGAACGRHRLVLPLARDREGHPYTDSDAWYDRAGWAESVSPSGELVHSLLEWLLAGVHACSGTEPRVAAKFLAEALDAEHVRRSSRQGGVAWMPQRD